jgi:DNA-binding FadR family transcriptional regulator
MMSRPLSRRALWLHKLAGEVARGLTEQIEDGRLPPGAALPSIDDLAARFVTTHAEVEQAMHDFSDQGSVVADPQGAFHVSPAPKTRSEFTVPKTARGRLEDVLFILELRLGFNAALAATRRDAAQMEAITAAAQTYADAVRTGEGTAQADFRFHRCIAAAAGNPYLLELLDYLGPLLIPRMRVPLTSTTAPDAPMQRSLAEHAEIVGAIKAQDVEAARQAMRAHLARTIKMMRGISAAEGAS